jgi:nucleoside-diphosphate-sugar epimerase
VYVDNVVSAVLLALEDERAVGRKLVVADEDGPSWRGLYEAYAALFEPALPVRSLPVDEWRRRSTSRGSFAAAVGELRSLLRSPEAAALLRAAAARPALRRVGARTLRLVPGGSRRARRLVESQRLRPPAAPASAAEQLPGAELAAVQTSGAVFRARELRSLGWEPRVPRDEALELTAAWLRFTRRLQPMDGG